MERRNVPPPTGSSTTTPSLSTRPRNSGPGGPGRGRGTGRGRGEGRGGRGRMNNGQPRRESNGAGGRRTSGSSGRDRSNTSTATASVSPLLAAPRRPDPVTPSSWKRNSSHSSNGSSSSSSSDPNRNGNDTNNRRNSGPGRGRGSGEHANDTSNIEKKKNQRSSSSPQKAKPQTRHPAKNASNPSADSANPQKKKSIRLLVCTANLGNAQPDGKSMDAWIPRDGRVEDVLPAGSMTATTSKSKVLLQPPPLQIARLRRPTNTQPSPRPSIPDKNSQQDEVRKPVRIVENKMKPPTRISSMDEYNRWVESQRGQNSHEKQPHRPAAKMQVVNEDVKDDYEAYLRSIQRESNDNNDKDYKADCYVIDDPTPPTTAPKPPPFCSRETTDEKADETTDEKTDGKDRDDDDGNVANEEDLNKLGDTDANTDDPGFFDVIVIGMQEATFDKDKKDKEKKKKTRKKMNNKDRSLTTASSKSDSSGDDDLSLSASEDEDEDDDDADNDNSQDFDSEDFNSFDDSQIIDEFFGSADDNEQPQPKNRRSSTSAMVGKKLLGATMKAGKVGLKAGKVGLRSSISMGRATVKTAKTVNTLATARDHSNRPLPEVSALEQDWREQHIMLEDGKGYPSGWVDTDVLHYRLEKEQLPQYKRVLSYQLGEMRLFVYFLPSLDLSVDVVDISHQATGKGGLANKGGIVADVSINNTTRLSFLSAHLEAHEGEKHYAARNSSLMDIIMGTKSSIQVTSKDKSTSGSTKNKVRFDSSLSSHMMFVMGDLNYRTKLTDFQLGSTEHIEQTHAMVEKKDWITLNHSDELRHALNLKECLVGFETPYCGFNPTFKVSRCDGYEYNIKRSPSYTDRILFKSNDQLDTAIRPLLYEPVEQFTTSDHKPIRSVIDVDLNNEIIWERAAAINDDKVACDKTGQASVDVESDFVDREKMHFFVSGIQCVIFPDEYDKIRRQEKAEIPNPFVRFVSTPAEALQVDTDDSWKRNPWKMFGFGSSKGQSSLNPFSSSKESKQKSIMSSKTSEGYPSTSTVKDTMRPHWKNENVHFTLRTHRDDGSPIDLSGAILYVSLRDGKGASSVAIGTCAINLSRLISVSHDKFQKPNNLRKIPGSPTKRQNQPKPGMNSNPKGRPSPSQSAGRGKMMRPEPRRPSNSGDNSKDWTYSKPSQALRNVSSSAAGRRSISGGDSDVTDLLPSPVKTASRSLQQHKHLKSKAAATAHRQKRIDILRTGSLRNVGSGPSPSLRNIMTSPRPERGGRKINGSNIINNNNNTTSQMTDDLNIMSLRLDEALTEGGLEIARIKCSVDVWWMKDTSHLKKK